MTHGQAQGSLPTGKGPYRLRIAYRTSPGSMVTIGCIRISETERPCTSKSARRNRTQSEIPTELV